MILHVITNFTARAGAEKMLARLISAAPDQDVLVVSLMGISEHNKSCASGGHVRFKALGAGSVLGFLRAMIALVGVIRRERPDVILCWMYHAMAIATLAHVLAGRSGALFWTVRQSLDDKASLSRSTRMAIGLCKLLSHLPAGIIYNSSRAMLLHQEAGFSAQASSVIPNGFTLPKIVRVADRAPRVFGIAGRLHTQKDHATFFRAAGLAAKAQEGLHFMAAGLGLEPTNPAVIQMLSDAGLRDDQVTLLGEIDDMVGFYSDIDVLVLSSRTEGFPNVVAEAMSYARPVITTDVGDAAHIVGQTGCVVPPMDETALSEAILKVAGLDEEQYQEKAWEARARISEKFLITRVADDYRATLTQPKQFSPNEIAT